MEAEITLATSFWPSTGIDRIIAASEHLPLCVPSDEERGGRRSGGGRDGGRHAGEAGEDGEGPGERRQTEARHHEEGGRDLEADAGRPLLDCSLGAAASCP